MWVRSQDKTSLRDCWSFLVQDRWVFGVTLDKTVIDLGGYSTEEKALKVLDMIQETITNNETVYAHTYSGSGVRDYDIFQMPEDEKV